jgi:hypothetical protein
MKKINFLSEQKHFVFVLFSTTEKKKKQHHSQLHFFSLLIELVRHKNVVIKDTAHHQICK